MGQLVSDFEKQLCSILRSKLSDGVCHSSFFYLVPTYIIVASLILPLNLLPIEYEKRNRNL